MENAAHTTEGLLGAKALKIGSMVLLAVAAPGVAILATPIAIAIFGPIAWLGSLWQGDPSLPMHQQLPVRGGTGDFGLAALLVTALTAAIVVHGRATDTSKRAVRIAMVTTALGLYLALLSTNFPYVVSRSLFSVIALAAIFGARLIPTFRPVKTVLFFIGVAFTCESLAWSLADATSSVIAFAVLTATALFFTRIDAKRARKTRRLAIAGSAAFVIAATQHVGFPLEAALAMAAIIATLAARRIKLPWDESASEEVQVFDTTPEGLSNLMYPRIESLGRSRSRIVYQAPELKVATDPNTRLVMFKVASVFCDKTSILIGCGTPNLATSVYDDAAGTWKRLSAFMLYRERSHITELDELQAGVYFELRGLTQAARQRLLAAMENHSGVRAPSCARLNARVLAEAGFTLGGGRKMTGVILPSRLAGLIWRFGLEHDGAPVSIRVVNTSPLEVSDHFVGVWRKEANSPIRLVHKALKGKGRKTPVAPVPAQPVAARTTAEWQGRPVTIWRNRPNAFGLLLTFLWGRHAEFKVSVPGTQRSPMLETPLESFSGPLSRLSKAKKYVLFSRPVVAMINRIKNKSFDRYDNVPVDAALEMMSPRSDGVGERALWNFALVMSGDGYQARMSPLKNLDPLSVDSKLRRISNWILAKHVVATGYDAGTVYAGEAWVQRSADGPGLTLFINDNSGTYKPTTEQLQAVGVLFRGLGIDVRTVTWADCPSTPVLPATVVPSLTAQATFAA